MHTTETDVVIVGAGPAGLSAALFLSTYGIPNVLVERYRWLAHTPRAHITNQRAVEILRDMGLEDEVVAKATPQHLMGNQVFCTSLAGEELARMRTWGTHPTRRAEYELASPSSICDLPQTLLEPILLEAAAARGTDVRFNTEYVSLDQDADGVTATVRHRPSGEQSQIRAKYLLGADGSRSNVAADIGLPLEGQMAIAGSMNIVIDADLTHLVAHRPSVLYWILQPGSSIGGVGMGVVRMVRPWDEWLLIWGYDINGPEPQVDEAEARRIAHRLIGDDSIDVNVRDISLWTNNRAYMSRYSEGRVFCMGDACHRHPPNNGLGSNTSIQDSYNLAWKLAHVLRGQADESLLQTYDAERAPIGRQIVERANQSIAEFGAIFEAFGLTEPDDAAQMRANMQARTHDTPEGAEQRQAAARGRADELRVQRPRRRAQPALPLCGRRRRRHRRARPRPRPRAALPPDDLARRPSAALLARARRPPDQHARPRRQRTLHAAHRHRRRSLARCRARGRGRHGGGDRRVRDRPGQGGARRVRRLGRSRGGRRGGLRARPAGPVRGVAQPRPARRRRRGARAGHPLDPRRACRVGRPRDVGRVSIGGGWSRSRASSDALTSPAPRPTALILFTPGLADDEGIAQPFTAEERLLERLWRNVSLLGLRVTW